MKDIIASAAIALVLGLAISYIIRQKKKGNECIGCPYAKQCSGNCKNKNPNG